MNHQETNQVTYHYAWVSEKLAQSYIPQGIPVHSFKTIDGKYVKMTHKSTDTVLMDNPIYKPEGCWDYTDPNELEFMDILEFPLVMWQ